MREHQDDRAAMLYPEGVVWVEEFRTFGRIVGSLGAHGALVNYVSRGIEYEVWLERDEFTLLEDITLEDTNEYEQDDE